MTQRLIVILWLLLAGLSLWLAAAPVAGRMFGPGSVSAGGIGNEPAAAPPEAVDLGLVLDAAPFGLADAARDTDTAAPAPGGLVLLGVTVAQDRTGSRAIIAGGDVPVANYGVESAISADVLLRDVFADHVMLDIGGQEQELRFPPGSGDGGALLSPAADAAAPADPGPDDETLLGRYRAEMVQDAAGLMDRLGLEVTEQGYRVAAAASDEVLRAGLLPDDVVTEVNGTSLRGLAPDPALLDRVAALGRASLAVQRAGTSVLMSFPLP